MTAIIVTRHRGAVLWLAEQGIPGEVIPHVDSPDQIRGRHVYGILPYHLAAEASLISVIDMPGLRPDQRGVDLEPEKMDDAGAVLRTYQVRVVPTTCEETP